MPKRGLEHYESRRKATLEYFGRYPFAAYARRKYSRYEQRAAQELGVDNATFVQLRCVDLDGTLAEIVKSLTLLPGHPRLDESLGVNHPASTDFTQEARDDGTDEFRNATNLFERKSPSNPLIRHRFKSGGDMWMLGTFRPERPGDIAAMYESGIGRDLLTTVEEGRRRTKPAIVCRSGIFGHQFVDGRNPAVVRRRLEIEADDYEKMTFVGEMALAAHAKSMLDAINRQTALYGLANELTADLVMA